MMTYNLTRSVLLFIIWSSFSHTGVLASDSIFTHVIHDTSALNVAFNDSLPVFIDTAIEYDLAGILALAPDKFEHPSSQTPGPNTPFVVWSRIQLVNNSNSVLNEYFSVCRMADSVSVFQVAEGQLIGRQITGSVFRPSQKILPSSFTYSSWSMDPGQAKTYYFKLYFSTPASRNHLTHVHLREGQSVINRAMDELAWQGIYAGTMLLFALLSLFVFGMFRERTFIYLALLMFFFAMYFLLYNGTLSVLLDVSIFHHYILIQRIFISGILIAAFLFVSNYIQLSTKYPKYYFVYLIMTLLTTAFTLVTSAFFAFTAWIDILINAQIFIWLILTLAPVVLFAKKGNKEAVVLLLSFIILIGCALIFTLGLVGVISFGGWSVYGFQIGTVLFSGMVFSGLFEKINNMREEKQRMEELDQLKSRFFANISHEFRTPLTLVMGPIQQVKEKLKDPEDKKLLQVACQNTERVLELINQLLDLSKLEAGKMEMKMKRLNIVKLIKGIVMSFESWGDRKNIHIHFISRQEEIFIYVDQEKIEKIFYNLLSNAFKFTKPQGEVSVLVTDLKNQVEISISDTGIGIANAQLPDVFNRFFQVNNKEVREQEGTGIGLALVKELTQLHKGEIRVDSKVGKGTTFYILLPKGKDHIQDQVVGITATAEENNETAGLMKQQHLFEPVPEAPPVDVTNRFPFGNKDHLDLPRVLIIEDNPDVRLYMKQSLSPFFQIEEAANGEEGIEKALAGSPDLIISDVMMPKKDGYEVCKTLKLDHRTSHIPIILLTAKAAREEKLRGLEIGADDYLLKPFDTKELQIRVRNLIDLRLQLRKNFSESPSFQPNSIRTNEVDKAFLEKVCAIIEANLSEEQFSVEVLANEVGMSRVHLNRKLKALTDHSPNKFIQAFRLQQALTFLQQKKGNVSEIAFEVGFGSTAYFVKCFREKYGTTPGSILEK